MLKWAGAFLAAFVAALVWRLQSVGEFKTLQPVSDGWTNCRRLPALAQGSEDLVVDSNETYAYISSSSFADVMKARNRSLANGGLFRLTLASDVLEAMTVEGVERPFMPHGVALGTGDKTLFVVAHGDGGDCVLELELVGLRAVRRRAVCSPLFVALNAVAAFGSSGSFLTINDHSRPQFTSPLLATVETLAGMASSSVLHCPVGERDCTVVIDNLPPMGVGLAVRGSLVFVSIPFRSSVGVYDAAKYFAPVREIAIGTNADNLHFLGSGDTLWIGAHPYLLKTMGHIMAGRPCPAQVLAIHNASAISPTVEVVFQRESGEPVSGVSTGFVVGGRKLLLGTVCDGFAICTK
jgi:hypothetical protein